MPPSSRSLPPASTPFWTTQETLRRRLILPIPVKDDRFTSRRSTSPPSPPPLTPRPAAPPGIRPSPPRVPALSSGSAPRSPLPPPPPTATTAPKRVLPHAPARQRPSYAPQAHDRQPRRLGVLLQCRRSRGGRRPSSGPASPLSRVALGRPSSPGRLFVDSIRIDGFQIDGFMTSDEVLLHETDFFARSLRLMECYFILIQSPPRVSRSTVILV